MEIVSDRLLVQIYKIKRTISVLKKNTSSTHESLSIFMYLYLFVFSENVSLIPGFFVPEGFPRLSASTDMSNKKKDAIFITNLYF